MEIKYWADIACPYCYVGITRLAKALNELKIADQTSLQFMSFQLDPTLPMTTKLTMPDYYAKSHKISKDQALAQLHKIDQFAATASLTIKMENAIPVNTLAAHRLIKYVETLNDQRLLNQTINQLYQLYFVANKSIANNDILTSSMTKLGLDASEVTEILNSNKYEDKVRKDERQAFMIGMPSAPLFVINNKYSITGAQPYEVFVESLKKINQGRTN
ncbi:DsbA family oxidoreductase [Limosilactobacillus sp. STM2_1]|uniref:DsbA family oxidoreductase n=1 Tax=Limosilactobacillus rudii TaxID=2759755 RepID=A0A7W3YMW5_9LACO|nr:DsbA family oxidoreductase [Limosilactobacillus rudii]MBB1078725.1 DsbA family oxidoreductase [Limosilactobacillus rudii]MBB1096707.1 DsbA family oxidoreductase [Limosilactobacillus rudii]MCD7135621.1 DsbA family oxidoreductase [Limosilactobacillus rudii]